VDRPITPWRRPACCATGRSAAVILIAFADEDVLGTAADLRLEGAFPRAAPVAAFDVRRHRYAESSESVDGWRTGALRNVAVQQLGDVSQLDAASCCYSISVKVDDPTDLTHLQLAWAVASQLAQTGACATLDVYWA